MRKITGLLMLRRPWLMISQASLYAQRVGPMEGGHGYHMKEHGGPGIRRSTRMQKVTRLRTNR